MGGVRADQDRRHDVNRWQPLCRAYDNAREMWEAIRAFDTQAVVTATIHAAKGGEWDHVLIVGATEGLLPLYLSCDSQSLDEERRLLYVAVTRARDSVRLYHAPTNHARSRQRFDQPSSFLVEPRVRGVLRVVNAQH